MSVNNYTAFLTLTNEMSKPDEMQDIGAMLSAGLSILQNTLDDLNRIAIALENIEMNTRQG